MTTPALAPVPGADGRPTWSWPINPDRYNRRPGLTVLDLEALRHLGMNLRRRRCYDRDAPEWHAIARLLRPLDDARAAMHCPDTPHHRRAITDAIGLILLRAAELETAYWAWTPQEWLRLIGTTVDEFERPWPGWIDGTVRPYVVAYGYLLCGFTDVDRLGPFNRLALTWRVFGKEPADHSIQQITDVLGRWGCRIGRGEDQRLPTVLCQAFLLNRSPLLEDLTTDAFARLRRDSAWARWHTGSLHGIQRAGASLGHCDPPSLSKHGSMPAIEGTAETWAAWAERWYDTSTLTLKVRRTFRVIMAKAGRWLAEEHPEITGPSRWTRQTCAAWVAKESTA